MVSLFTMFVARGVEMPAMDPRLKAQLDPVVPTDQQGGPATHEEAMSIDVTPAPESGQ